MKFDPFGATTGANTPSTFSIAFILAYFISTAGTGSTYAQGWEQSKLRDLVHLNTTSPYYVDADPAITWVGDVTSEADTVMGAHTARMNFGVDGSGVKIGIISDSFDALNGAADGVSSGDLPGSPEVNVLSDDPIRTDEGRGMAELVHDLAPGAELLFHSAFNNGGTTPSSTIATAINNLVAAGADIIVDDVAMLTTPMYQDGASAQAVDAAFAAGVAYFSSAGNSSNNAYEATFNGTGGPIQGTMVGGNVHDFNTSAGVDTILDLGMLDPGQQVRATLWWDDPYASLGGTPTADFDLAILADGAVGIVAAQDQLSGADPFEFVGAENPDTGMPVSIGLAIDGAAGDVLGKALKIVVSGMQISDPNDTNSPTIFGHSAAKGAVAVGAQFFNEAGLDDVESFSSQGPTTILFDAAGNRLTTPEIRNTPQLTGVDGTNTTFFPPGVDIEPDGFSNFFGTSAAAPHVAAIAALVLERAAQLGQSLSPADLYNLLYNAAVDIETAGFDNLSGFGRLDALAAVSAVVPEPAATMPLLIGLAGLASSMQRRRAVPGVPVLAENSHGNMYCSTTSGGRPQCQ